MGSRPQDDKPETKVPESAGAPVPWAELDTGPVVVVNSPLSTAGGPVSPRAPSAPANPELTSERLAGPDDAQHAFRDQATQAEHQATAAQPDHQEDHQDLHQAGPD